MNVSIQQGKLPEAYYRIHDLEAQKFVGKCLANVSERLSAKELLLDPFLAKEQLDSPLPSPTLPKKQAPTLNFTASLAKELSQPKSNQTKDSHMTITGSINEEDDTVFLKVQISNKDGMHIKFHITRYYYFVFMKVLCFKVVFCMQGKRETFSFHLTPYTTLPLMWQWRWLKNWRLVTWNHWRLLK